MRARLLGLAAVAIVLCTACENNYPGEPVGSFTVVGTLKKHECGQSAVPATDPLSFPVELRVDGAQAFWRRPDAPLVAGSLSRDDVFTFRSHHIRNVLAADPDFALAGCTVEQDETVSVQLEIPADATDATTTGADAGAQPELSGTHDIDLRPAAGTDCARALGSAGGPFLTLPCEIQYELVGQTRDSF